MSGAPVHLRPSVDETRNPWRTTSTTPVYANAWIEVRHDEVLDPSGRPGVYGVVSPRAIALGVLPVHADGTTELVGQYRYPHGAYSWEMPEGGGAKDVDPLDSIARELREETGLLAKNWHEVCRLSLSNSISDELAVTWVAWELTEGEDEPESTEELAHWRLPFGDAVAMVWDGRITDAMTVATVAKLEAMRLAGTLPTALAEILG
jgi:ADP-ribose pyrophosphatase